MIKSVNVTQVRNTEAKEETIVTSVDMVLTITDVAIYKLLRKYYGSIDLLNFKKYEFISDTAMEPVIFDRTTKNMIKWLSVKDGSHNLTDEEFDNMLDSFIKDKCKEIYELAEPTDLMKGLPIILEQNALKKFNIIVAYDEKVRQAQLNKLVSLIGPYAYRVGVIIPEKEGMDFLDIIKAELPKATTIIYNDIDILPQAVEKEFNLRNLSFSFSNLSYNYEYDKEINAAYLKYNIDSMVEQYGVGITTFDLKKFDKEEYFARG